MSGSSAHIKDLTRQIESLEGQIQVLRDQLPLKVRFQMALRHTRARTSGAGLRTIANAATTAVSEVRPQTARRR
jgi:hypothetical protein